MRFLWTVAIIAALAAPPALATGSAAGARRNFSPAEAMRKMGVVTRCAAETYPEEAARLLMTPRGSDLEGQRSYNLVSKSWMRCSETHLDAMSFDITLLRGGLAEALYLAREGAGHVPDAAPEAAHDPSQFRRPGFAVLSLFGGCVAAARPAQVHALLLTQAGSEAEMAALDALRPALAPCLLEGVSADFSRAQLRAYFAEAMYRQTASALVVR